MKLRVILFYIVVIQCLVITLSIIFLTIPPNFNFPKINNKNFFLVGMLYNNEDIVQIWCDTMFEVAHYLRKIGCDVYISVIENGDSTDRTAEYLERFKERLDKEKISNTIITTHTIPHINDRIDNLAALRNKAMEPLTGKIESWDPTHTRIIYFNDIVFTLWDILELIFTNDFEYDIACALDFYGDFYDIWVSRDISGKRLISWPPNFRDKTAAWLVLNRQPIRVYSCWNGVLIMKAEPFMDANPVKYRRFNSSEGEIYSSESFLICRDFWKRGLTKVLVNTNVRVAYERYYYYLHKYFYPWNWEIWMTLYRMMFGMLDPENRDSADYETAIPPTALEWKSFM